MTKEDQKAIEVCTAKLIQSPHSVKKWLTLADKYMQTFVADPEQLLLPKAHGFLKPLIEAYAYKTESFTQYILGVRDSFDKSDLAWEHAQSVYRRVNGRHTQQIRRERSGRAVAKAQELHGKAEYHARLKWVADLEHDWANRRLAFLDQHRAKFKSNRLDTETRAELLAEFWDVIDTEIYEGDIPPWS
jgi:hypothetical protein